MQLIDAVPPIPAPPIKSVYEAVAPAFTTALEPPWGTLNPRLGPAPWPDKATVSSGTDPVNETESSPILVPVVVGAKKTEITHEFAPEVWGPNPEPQVLDSVKSPEASIREIPRIPLEGLVRVMPCALLVVATA